MAGVLVGSACRAHLYPHFFRASFKRRASTVVDAVPGGRTEGEEAREDRTCLGFTPVDGWFGSESHLNPTGFYNKAWGRVATAHPQERWPLFQGWPS